MIEDFKKELDVLLTKYPDLPEFTITIRPRVSIEVKSEVKQGTSGVKTYSSPSPSHPADLPFPVPKITPNVIEEMNSMIQTQ